MGGMIMRLSVRVTYGPWRREPLAQGKGVTARWGLKEAGSKLTTRGIRSA